MPSPVLLACTLICELPGLPRAAGGQAWGIAMALTLVSCAPPPPPSAYAAALAQHLSATGAAVYGAEWCPHSGRQKHLFGPAAESLPYVECTTDGPQSQAQLCQSRGVSGYPTWDINGVLYPGVYSLGGLAELSGFPPPP